jgi:hypothetical protein
LPHLDITFIKVINKKKDFEKKIYNPSRIEIFILGHFQNVRGFLFWVAPIIMAQSKKKKKKLELDRHPQCPSNSHTQIARSFMLNFIYLF